MKIFNLKEDGKIYPFKVLIVSKNEDKIKQSVESVIRFYYQTVLSCEKCTSDYLDDMTEELIQNKEIEIKKGDIVLFIDLSNKLYSNHGKRRNIVMVDEDLLPVDEIKKEEIIEDTYDAITEIWGLNDPIKNIPKTFII